MKVLLSVIGDLFSFAKEVLVLSWFKPHRPYKSLPPSIVVNDVTTSASTSFVKTVEANEMSFVGHETLSEGFIAVPEAKMFLRPVWAVDTVIKKLPLGTVVSPLRFEGRFIEVMQGELRGWILKDEVAKLRSEVWPTLENKHTYLANDEETKKIRTLINDEFFTSELFLPLQASEYITYQFLEQKRQLPWGNERPRLAGLWHELLRGKRGVVIGIEPKTGSIMESYPVDEEPQLAYVTAVLVDNSIIISAVGRYHEGEYLAETLTAEEVLALRPVFIQFS